MYFASGTQLIRDKSQFIFKPVGLLFPLKPSWLSQTHGLTTICVDMWGLASRGAWHRVSGSLFSCLSSAPLGDLSVVFLGGAQGFTQLAGSDSTAACSAS